jgi:4-alpha-glucanotransferase
MSLLQFAFGNDPQGPSFRPHNYTRDLVAYTGGHDNDTTVGWWPSAGGFFSRTLSVDHSAGKKTDAAGDSALKHCRVCVLRFTLRECRNQIP